MRTLVKDGAWVHYGQIYVRSGEDDPEFEECFTGHCWGGERYWPLDLTETSYRVRYCATGMDEGRELDTRVIDDEDQEDEDRAYDRYVLQFWPAPPAPDQVLRQTSETAAYWHGWVREQA